MHFARVLDATGDGTGTKVANVNFGAGGYRIIKPSAGEVLEIHSLNIHIQDAGAFTAALYGFAAELDPGISVKLWDADFNELIDFTDAIPLINNSTVMRWAHSWNYVKLGAGDEALDALFDFSKLGGPLRLNGDAGHQFGIYAEEDLSALTAHYFTAYGKTQ